MHGDEREEAQAPIWVQTCSGCIHRLIWSQLSMQFLHGSLLIHMLPTRQIDQRLMRRHIDSIPARASSEIQCVRERKEERGGSGPVRLAYQPPTNNTFLSEQTSHQQSASSTFLSEQISTSHQLPAKRTNCKMVGPAPHFA
jgi:hypothetical protein